MPLILFLENRIMCSLRSVPFASEYYQSCGPRILSMKTSNNFQNNVLLPTPEARNHIGYTKSHGRKALKLGTLLSSPAAFPANLSRKPDEEKERKMTAISGRKCFESSKNGIRNGSLLRMCVASLLGTTAWYSKRCALTWNVRDTKSKRLLFLLSASAHPIEEKGYGSLLVTPSTRDWKDTPGQSIKRKDGRSRLDQASRQVGHATGLKLQPNFVEWMMGFPQNWTDLNCRSRHIVTKGSNRSAMRLSRK